MTRRHAPAQHGAALEPAEDEVLDGEPDDDHGEQAREHEIGVHLEAVLVDEPAEPALTAGHAEYHLRGDDRAPRERPADLEAREDVGKRCRQQDARDETPAGEAEVLADAPQRQWHRDEARVRAERHRPQHRVDDDEHD